MPEHHPISSFATIGKLIHENYENTKDLIETFKIQEGVPGKFYEIELERALKIFDEGVKNAALFINQIRYWEQSPLTDLQRKQVNHLGKKIYKMPQMYKEAIALVKSMSAYTIDVVRKGGKEIDTGPDFKEKVIKELEKCQDYLVITIAAESKNGIRDTNLHISNIPLLEEALSNMARENPRFRDMMLDAIMSFP